MSCYHNDYCMRIKTCLLPFLILLSLTTFSQSVKENKAVYNETLAKRLGGENGMKKYVIAFLKSGPTKLTDSTARAKLQEAHMNNIQRMADEGKLVLAGPFLDGKALRGIYIFNVESVEEAKKLTETDPAVKAGTLEMELHPWYGSAALQEVPTIHKTIVAPAGVHE